MNVIEMEIDTVLESINFMRYTKNTYETLKKNICILNEVKIMCEL